MAQSKPLVGESHNIDRKLKPQLRGDQAGLYTMDLQVLGPFVIYVNTSQSNSYTNALVWPLSKRESCQ